MTWREWRRGRERLIPNGRARRPAVYDHSRLIPVATISVIIGTYGEDYWQRLARERALVSALDEMRDAEEGTVTVTHVHLPDGTLAEARNAGAKAEQGDWLCFLDGDDELAPGYLDAMSRSLRPGHLLTPRVSYIGGGRRETPPQFHTEVDYPDGNWLVIGTLIERSAFWAVGGFEEWPIYEDWALFARMQKAGAGVAKIPSAVYRAYRRPNSRNHAVGRNGKLAAHDQIRRAVFPELYEEG